MPNKKDEIKHYGMMISKLAIVYLLSTTAVLATTAAGGKNTVEPVSFEHVLNWSFALLVVLALFFAGVWLMRKMGALPANNKDNLRVVGGLSLGMREKLLVVQIGKKQMVLAVTPGKIDNLLVLEGEEQLFQQGAEKTVENEFAKRLKQIMTGADNE